MTHSLYKFVSNHDYILKDGYIRATQLSALNDPFEAVYCKDSLIRLSKEFEYDYLIDINQIEVDKHKIGVISFTESKDNLLMWAHYANEYKGSLIGISKSGYVMGSIFKNLFPFYNSSLIPIFEGKLEPVTYRKQPMYKIDMFDRDYSNISITGENQILYEIFQQKSEEWIYEKEHRIILRLEQADKIVLEDLEDEELDKLKEIFIEDESIIEKNTERNQTIFYLNKIEDEDERSILASLLTKYSKNPNNLYLFKLCPHSICSLIFGQNAKSFDFNSYVEKWNSRGYFDVYKSRINKSTYTLDFEKLHSKFRVHRTNYL